MKVKSMRWRCDIFIITMCGVVLKNRGCRNSGIREWCGLKEGVLTRVEKGKLLYFVHLRWMNEGRLTEQMYRANVCDGKAGEGGPRIAYMQTKLVAY
ncbi:hypothetical protein EVAR_88062_1 [Eumeta japonica]|uniref:Uncharacterized protein n=1 Tax=Eumeta variegata TaxID=151549 RepID=A0A4C1WJ92_EUMVA|nr:hypothetical protein EVAR_88062_1 [Eumeta japonica]